MGLIFRLSFRNLIRQRRRNLLLGIVIAFGMMILVIANSFSHGLVDVLINDVVSNVYGHLVVEGNTGFMYGYTMIRDKERIEKIIRENIDEEDLIYMNENLGMFGRAVGNGEADNIVVVGVDANSDEAQEEFFNDFFTLVEGDFNEYFSKDIQYPIIISENKANSLNVKLHDVIRVRLPMVTGQIQAAKLTVIAIANANNSFMDIVLFMDAYRVKELLGYKPWESASLQVTLKDPRKNAEKYADILHEKLKPEIISTIGKIGNKESQLLAFKNTDQAKEILIKNIKIISGDREEGLAKDGVMISEELAQKTDLQVGDEFKFQYQTKYRGLYGETLKIDAIYQSDTKLGKSIVLLNEERIHEAYNKYVPADSNQEYIKEDNDLFSVLATEWKLLERSKDSQALQKKYKEQRKIKTDQAIFDVVTMYEGASDILKLEGVLNLITIIAVMVLFFIILIGVVNSLRMTIKERTREIGTVRAIGMQKKDIRNQFIMETLFLTLISCITGIVLGIIVMYGLTAISLDVNNALSMILKDGHINFKLNPTGILTNFILILLIAGITAYFPARRAANLAAVDALRHYE